MLAEPLAELACLESIRSCKGSYIARKVEKNLVCLILSYLQPSSAVSLAGMKRELPARTPGEMRNIVVQNHAVSPADVSFDSGHNDMINGP